MMRTIAKDDARAAVPRPTVPSTLLSACAVAGWAAAFAPVAGAYVGPGAGMGLLGVMLALVAAILMALVGLVLWPIRMVAYRRKSRLREKGEDAQRAADEREQEAGRESAAR